MPEPLAGAWAPIHLSLWEKLGLSANQVLNQYDLANLLISQNRVPVSLELRGLLFDALAAEYDDPILGLRTGSIYNVFELGVLGYAIMTSPTIGAALQVGARYFSLYSDLVHFDLTVAGDQASLSLTPKSHSFYSRHQLEAIIAGIVNSPLATDNGECFYTKVQLPYAAPCNPVTYQQVLGCPAEFEKSQVALLFPTSVLQTRLKTADEDLHKVHLEMAEKQLQAMAPPTSLHDEIKRRLWNMLQEGTPLNMAKLTDQMHFSTRNLQLRLQQEGYSYRKITQQIRKELAIQLVSSSKVSLKDIHYLLGYSDASTFYQAFKRWTGKTPGAYRRGSSHQ